MSENSDRAWFAAQCEKRAVAISHVIEAEFLRVLAEWIGRERRDVSDHDLQSLRVRAFRRVEWAGK